MSNEKSWESLWGSKTMDTSDYATRAQALNMAMMQSGGLANAGGHYGSNLGGFGQANSVMSTPAPSKEDMIRDLLARAVKRAGAPVGNATMITIDHHRALVKELLQDFEEGASYIQAQMNMVESAYKQKPELLQRLTRALSTAYHSLVQSTFGD